MPGSPREEEIKRIAYEIWEQEGRPDGKDFEHYMRAEKTWERRAASLRETPPTLSPAVPPARPADAPASPRPSRTVSTFAGRSSRRSSS
jgi:hypothetical protein